MENLSSEVKSFEALVARKSEDKKYSVNFETLSLSDLPEGEVLIRIEYSGLNYKDALAITGRAPIVRKFPMVLGIDLAGTVQESQSPLFSRGDSVIVNGFGLSETKWGAYSLYQSVSEKFVTPLPSGISCEQAMQIGTAGYTAMLCVLALLNHGLDPARDKIVVTGASGGVGSIAVALLAKLKFHVTAVTGRKEHGDFLRKLGASEVIDRIELDAGGKVLAGEKWAGAVDVAGGEILAQILAQTQYRGIVTCCGMAGGGELPATVYPFILRGITLRGIDSVMVPQEDRKIAWQKLDELLDRELLAELSSTHEFKDLPQLAEDLLQGRLRGRVAVRIPST